MRERVQRWTSWSGGPLGLLLVVLAQVALVGALLLSREIAFAAILGVCAVILVVDRPILGVGLLVVARLVSTGATIFFRIGHMGIGPMEPVLALCVGALVFHAALRGRRLWHPWPWRAPYFAMMAWMTLSAAWSVDPGGLAGDLLPMLVVIASTTVILTFVDTWDDFRLMLWFWVGASALIGILTIVTDALGIQVGTVTFQAAAGGGRETGLGQQPNWYAMNLMFIIHTCFGMALLERRRLLQLLLVGAGFFIFVMMLKSGSRGGAYATLIGGALAALAHPLFRKWFFRFGAVTAVIFAIGIAFNVGDSAKALTRIGSEVGLNSNVRALNWLVCWEMFRDTFGRGIGVSGYEDLLPRYNNYVAQSLYDYPHGIFWETLAHYGVVGLGILAWVILAIARMAAETVRLSRGTEAEVFAWTMPAAMLGYFAWSFMEFTFNEKPFWEFLALYTALYLVLRKARAEGRALPPWSAKMALFRRASA